MILDKDTVERTINSFFKRCEAAKAAGGIALCDQVDGIEVPKDWILDYETYYFLPPNVRLL
jgi:hypothetical protein